MKLPKKCYIPITLIWHKTDAIVSSAYNISKISENFEKIGKGEDRGICQTNSLKNQITFYNHNVLLLGVAAMLN